MYAKARSGAIKEFTGISSPYEAPDTPELKIDTGAQDLAESVNVVIKALQDKGVIPAACRPASPDSSVLRRPAF